MNNQSITQSNQPNKESITQPNKPIKPIKQTVNRSTDQSINQTTKANQHTNQQTSIINWITNQFKQINQSFKSSWSSKPHDHAINQSIKSSKTSNTFIQHSTRLYFQAINQSTNPNKSTNQIKSYDYPSNQTIKWNRPINLQQLKQLNNKPSIQSSTHSINSSINQGKTMNQYRTNK